MNDGQSRLLALKAYALLAGEGGDPAVETALGVALTDDEKMRVRACATEAHDALVPLPGSPEPGGVLLHPLSAEVIPRKEEAKPPDVTAMLQGRAADQADLPRWYARLWRDVMNNDYFGSTPADRRLRDHTLAAHRSLTAALVGATYEGGRPALLTFQVAPVQGYIKAARRTHDLSLGSYTIGFLAFQGALALARALGPDVLINPDVSCRALADKLLFGDKEVKKEELLQSALMNKVVALVPEREAGSLAKRALDAICAAWKTMAEKTLAHLKLSAEESKGFMKQIQDHLELDAVVLPWPEKNAEIEGVLAPLGDERVKALSWLNDGKDHPGAASGPMMDLLERELAAHRKGMAPRASLGDHRPKCTVCGLWEQMGPITSNPSHQQGVTRAFFERLSEGLQHGEEPRASIQLTHGEGLCAVCLTKRFMPEVYYGNKDASGLGIHWKNEKERPILRFPSTATIASAPLRLYLHRKAGDPHIKDWLTELDKLHKTDALSFTPPGNLLPGLVAVGGDDRLLAQEGTWLYESAYDPDVAWRGHYGHEPNESDGKERRKYENVRALMPRALKAFRGLSGAVEGKGASAYYAVIVLDGDKMGDWKSGKHDDSPTFEDLGVLDGGVDPTSKRPLHPALHGELSRRVARLGTALHKIVHDHLGRIVYHGGDDLLCVLPLSTALHCLSKINEAFQKPAYLGKKVTISAGVAVSHWHDPLARTLEAARKAEERSKDKGRNRFTLHADKRSGEDLSITLPWQVSDIEVIPAILKMVDSDGEEGFADAKAAYQLRDELFALGHNEMRPAFLHRVSTLMFKGLKKKKESAPVALELLRALYPDAPKDARESSKTIVDLMLFVRFLLREEHKVNTNQLLKDLGVAS